MSFNGTSALDCSNNTFVGQTSVSSVPLEISITENVFAARIQNNIFNNNTTGSVRLDLNNAIDANVRFFNNTITNNGTGSQSSLDRALLPFQPGLPIVVEFN